MPFGFQPTDFKFFIARACSLARNFVCQNIISEFHQFSLLVMIDALVFIFIFISLPNLNRKNDGNTASSVVWEA